MNFELLGIHIVQTVDPLKPILIGKFDTIINLSISVNLALGILRVVQDSIEDFFESLRNLIDRFTTFILVEMVLSKIITEEQAFNKAKSIRKLSYIKGSKFETRIRVFSITFAILEAFLGFCFLYCSAIYPDTKIEHVTARFIILSCIAPLIFFILLIVLRKIVDIIYAAFVIIKGLKLIILSKISKTFENWFKNNSKDF